MSAGPLISCINHAYIIRKSAVADDEFRQHLSIIKRSLQERHLRCGMERNDPNQFRFVEEADGDVNTTIKYIKKCLKVSLSQKNMEQEGEALSYIGLAYFKLGKYQQANDYHEQHLQLAESLDDCQGKRRALCNLGCVYKATGDLPMALYYFEKAYEICKDRGDMKALGRVSNNIANIYEMLMDTEKAIEYHKERYEAANSIDDLHGKGKACVSLGALYLVTEDLEKSMFYYEELLCVLRAKLRKYPIHI